MYGLQANVDLSFFVGRTLGDISFSEHSIVLNFDGQKIEPRVSLGIQSAVSLKILDGKKYEWEDFRQGASFLVALIGNTVAAVKGNVNGTLTIEFQEGSILEVYDNSKQYESYQIRLGPEFIIVV